MKRREARAYREKIDRLIEDLDEREAADAAMLFPAWHAGRDYQAGDRVRYGGKLYRVVQGHTSQANWLPDEVPALYEEIVAPASEGGELV